MRKVGRRRRKVVRRRRSKVRRSRTTMTKRLLSKGYGKGNVIYDVISLPQELFKWGVRI